MFFVTVCYSLPMDFSFFHKGTITPLPSPSAVPRSNQSTAHTCTQLQSIKSSPLLSENPLPNDSSARFFPDQLNSCLCQLQFLLPVAPWVRYKLHVLPQLPLLAAGSSSHEQSGPVCCLYLSVVLMPAIHLQ